MQEQHVEILVFFDGLKKEKRRLVKYLWLLNISWEVVNFKVNSVQVWFSSLMQMLLFLRGLFMLKAKYKEAFAILIHVFVLFFLFSKGS